MREMPWPPSNYRPDFGRGYQITFDEFRQLISYPYYQPPIAALLRDWYGYEIVGSEDKAVVRDASGVVDLKTLFEAIQADPQKQYYLYQSAQTLWR